MALLEQEQQEVVDFVGFLKVKLVCKRLGQELGHGRIVSTHSCDIQTYRWKNHQPFTNLLELVL